MAVLITSLIAYFIPDMPSRVKDMYRREAFLYNDIVMKTELAIAKGDTAPLTDDMIQGIRRRTTIMTKFLPSRSLDETGRLNSLDSQAGVSYTPLKKRKQQLRKEKPEKENEAVGFGDPTLQV